MGTQRSLDAQVYEKPDLYDLAFSYRDYQSECDAVLAWYRRQLGGEPRTVLELAAGPADHALELARRGVRATALDLSPTMCAYAAKKARAAGVPLELMAADMIDFRSEARFELVLLMLNSIMHLHTLDELVRHFSTVARHLDPQRGAYVLEVQHPRDFVGRAARKSGLGGAWSVSREGLELSMRWGREDDPYDALRQIFTATVELELNRGGETQRFSERVAMRDWTKTEIEAALALSGALYVAELHGDFAADAPLDDSEQSWRMLMVLRPR